MGTGDFNIMDKHLIQGGTEVLLVALSCIESGDKRKPHGPPCSDADFAYL